MLYRTLITAHDVHAALGNPAWAIVDCRFSLLDVDAGRRAYLEAHIPGALYASVETDLSGEIIPGTTGRHPLPRVDVLAARLGAWGIDEVVQVVAYDDTGGSMAARLWWLLRWLGHDAVAVLDGGWTAWLEAGYPVESGTMSRAPRRFTPRERPAMVATWADVDARRRAPSTPVFDSRSADRYRGENETIDPVAGHIPGARSAPFKDNLGPDGRFLAPDALRARYTGLLDGAAAEDATFYCGSGVTAAHSLLALAHAGLGDAALYAGSWSEWITDPHRPVTTGENP